MTSPFHDPGRDLDQGPDDDARWLAALAGRPLPGTTAATAAEAAWLRRVVTSSIGLQEEADVSPAQAAARRERLIERARAAGLLAERPGAAGWRTRWGWRASCRWCARFEPPGWAGALALGLMLALGTPALWQSGRLAPAGEEDSARRAAAPVLRVAVADPLRSRSELARQLAAAGAQVAPYERAGRPGLDAEWPAAARPAVAEVLARAGLTGVLWRGPVTAGDLLLIEFEPMGGEHGHATEPAAGAGR